MNHPNEVPRTTRMFETFFKKRAEELMAALRTMEGQPTRYRPELQAALIDLGNLMETVAEEMERIQAKGRPVPAEFLRAAREALLLWTELSRSVDDTTSLVVRGRLERRWGQLSLTRNAIHIKQKKRLERGETAGRKGRGNPSRNNDH